MEKTKPELPCNSPLNSSFHLEFVASLSSFFQTMMRPSYEAVANIGPSLGCDHDRCKTCQKKMMEMVYFMS